VKVVLNKRPEAEITPETFKLEKSALPKPDSLKPGQVFVEVLMVSLDPAMRGWISDAKSYMPPVGLGEVMRASGIGKISASTHAELKVGQLVSGFMGWQSHLISEGKGLTVLPDVGLPPSVFLGALGMTGLTAYFGLFEVGNPKKGETVLVSGAAGATGSIVGQLAKIHGCRVVGIAGGAEKAAWLTKELGFDAVIDYKATPDLAKAIQQQCPKGVDVCFDNVGGSILDAALGEINSHARVVICGAISQYNKPLAEHVGPKNYLRLLATSSRMEGFIVSNYASKYREGQTELAKMVKSGQLKYKEDIVQGLENCPKAILKLFEGGNQGKLIVQVAPV